MIDIPEIFASKVFTDDVMKSYLPTEIYEEFEETVRSGRPLSLKVADTIASAMRDWAMSKGVTHYTHWFQPMTGITAEKHESFVDTVDGKHAIMKFSGKALVQGEPDASSFPSGGLRATFEARGYTAWDPTSYAFIKENTLCIPTAFCSYNGAALDKKTPLLRSIEIINKQAMRIVKLFGNNDVKKVVTTVGPEQEYFLIDKSVFDLRPDLITCGRTLFGARPPKGQDLDDHYSGAIKPRVKDYMSNLDIRLWELGVFAKTEHNETAPAQHELAVIFDNANLATDYNQLTMEIMRSTASRHGMVCLLHEKPFEAVNGSGKHNNWSLSTDTGVNLLEPGETPYENAQFLLFLTAVIKAVDEYQDLLRISIASAGNDHRLGANEAPPAIISMFLGDELTEILDAVMNGSIYSGKKKVELEIGVSVLPHFPKDTTDRNRTSPFAFTGNKFEFRMPGSSSSIAGPNTVLNTIVAEELKGFADELEGASDFHSALNELIRRNLKEHKRIIFNGNNYSDEWRHEAEKRGLSNYRTTVDALPHYLDKKNVDLFVSNGVYTEVELESRYEILMENYIKTLHIEALTAIDMVKQSILPAVISYEGELSKTIKNKRIAVPDISVKVESDLLCRIDSLLNGAYSALQSLESGIEEVSHIDGILNVGVYYRDRIVKDMSDLRYYVDSLESTVDKKVWPYPSYAEMLYSVK